MHFDKKIWKKYVLGELSWKRLLRSVLSIYGCLFVFALVWSDKMIFQPQPASYEDGEEVIKLVVDGGETVAALYLVDPAADYTVLYCHANAVDLGDIRPFLARYRDEGFSVLAYDYRGYGVSEGRATARNACADADTALRYLSEQEKISLDRIIVHGRSVGGGPALYLAHGNDVAGVIVESSFVTAYRVVTRVPLFPMDKFRNIAIVDEVDCPVLVIHGREDETIPLWHGEMLFKAAKEPKSSCWLDDATHDSMSANDGEVYWAAIRAFVE